MLAPRPPCVPYAVPEMPLVSMRQLLDEAAEGGYGVGAFNVNNMEQIQAIMEAARETASPVIVQASRGARSYTNDRFLWHLMQAAVELYPEIPVALHLDHGNEPDDVHLSDRARLHERDDGRLAARPTARRLRLRATTSPSRARSSSTAHARGVTVEGELGTLGGIEDGARLGRGAPHRPRPGGRVRRSDRASTRSRSPSAPRTAPTSSRRPPDGEVLAMERIEEIHKRLPETHLVMHGSSSVPQELVEHHQPLRRLP